MKYMELLSNKYEAKASVSTKLLRFAESRKRTNAMMNAYARVIKRNMRLTIDVGSCHRYGSGAADLAFERRILYDRYWPRTRNAM